MTDRVRLDPRSGADTVRRRARRLLALWVSSTALAISPQALHGAPAAGQTARDLVRVSKPGTPLSVPRGYAVVIGVSNYRNLDASKQLQFPESDAEAIHRVLISREGGAFPAENVRLLTGSQATLASIKHALEEWLPSVAQPADRVVVYFAGHGLVKDGKGYLAPWDVDPERLEETAYPMAILGDVLANKVSASSRVLLTDACHSGKINAETNSEALDRQFNALPANFLNLTATTERDQSFEDADLAAGSGVFTYFLVQAFRGHADSDPCDGRITADELIEYVRSNVRRYARDRQLTQTPTARGDYDPAMLLAVAPACLSDGAKQTPSMLGTAIVETNMDEVDVYIDGALIGRMSRAKPLVVPSLSAGLHEFQGVKAGYVPERKDVMIAPGQEVAVTLRIRYVRQIKKSALELNERGEKLLFTRRSSLSLMNLLPVGRQQSADDLARAAVLFEAALKEDPTCVVAAYHLGQVQQLLLDLDAAETSYRRAIAIDPAHLGSRIQLAAVLIESGDPDDAIRQLTEAQRLDPTEDDVYSMLARAYWDKGAWPQAVEQADKALAINHSNAQAHLWKADAMRQLAAAEQDLSHQLELYGDAREDYRQFLRLTNFETGLGARLAFHFIGFRAGGRRHADRQAAYDSLRSSGFMGLCIAEHKVGNALRAREYCQRALRHAPEDPIGHFLLGNVNRDIYNARQSCEDLSAARASYLRMLALNSDLQESRNARNYLGQIDAILPQLGCRTS